MKKASIRLPATPTARKCWIGSYGGHFSVVVVYNVKPVKDAEFGYDQNTNYKIITGTFDLDSFNEWFGTKIKAKSTTIDTNYD